MEKAYNLLDEKWILATDVNGKSSSYSLKEIFANAHEIKQLSGEMATQDVAVLRLLLAIMHCIYTRKPEYQEARENLQKKVVLDIWKNLYERGQFDFDEFDVYLESYRDRFYLIHPERPFYQVANMQFGTPNKSSKLVGSLSESNNKLRLFQTREGIGKSRIDLPEAARWLIHLNSYDDVSLKQPKELKKEGKSPSAKLGWLGQIGLVCVVGKNLFETLMLNCPMYCVTSGFWDDGQAPWELEIPRESERTLFNINNSQINLLTFQSRRIKLHIVKEKVEGYIILAGDYFENENVFSEQMTAWKIVKNVYKPQRHDPSKQFWRGLTAQIKETDSDKVSGVVKWFCELKLHRIIPVDTVIIRATAIKYDIKQAASQPFEDYWEDEISLSSDILPLDVENYWIVSIDKVLKMTDDMVKFLGFFAVNIEKAKVKSDTKDIGEGMRKIAKEEAYFRLDEPFRMWLASINPSTDDQNKKLFEWLGIARNIVITIGKELVENAGTKAIVGRIENDEPFSAAKSYLIFQRSINKIYYPSEKEGLNE